MTFRASNPVYQTLWFLPFRGFSSYLSHPATHVLSQPPVLAHRIFQPLSFSVFRLCASNPPSPGLQSWQVLSVIFSSPCPSESLGSAHQALQPLPIRAGRSCLSYSSASMLQSFLALPVRSSSPYPSELSGHFHQCDSPLPFRLSLHALSIRTSTCSSEPPSDSPVLVLQSSRPSPSDPRATALESLLDQPVISPRSFPLESRSCPSDTSATALQFLQTLAVRFLSLSPLKSPDPRH